MWLSQTRRLEALKQAVRSGIYGHRRLRAPLDKGGAYQGQLNRRRAGEKARA